ncbi:hypothetical protein IEQ34_004367 [Dendrobium chrysotoxum]|uniref:Uncharacterized protein n=1 Tax=Dendrobium chrysotoxum TaxID=161865 RepID=A0AAV7H019_DENCH|nr:hypothetical protein IEQ34_004367 [Dendrobium chrysotoxum]
MAHDHGHTTEAYKPLKNEIERLIRQGYLQQFIQDSPARDEARFTGGQNQQQERQPLNNIQMVGEIE